MKNYDEQITFSINQVAKQIGVVPATIRNWEKQGLIEVKRSSNNYRFFTIDDLEHLQKIKEYSLEKHLGVQAIKMLLPNTGVSSVSKMMDEQKENFYSKSLVVRKWKKIREQQHYTLEEVSRAVGISTAHLSKLENGNANITLEMLNKLAEFYRENPLYFVESGRVESNLVPKDTGERFSLKENNGIEMQSLVSLKEHTMYPVMCVVPPGEGNHIPHTHNGDDMIYLFSGKLQVHLRDDPPYIVHPGDTLYYHGSDLHRWKNISSKPATLLWVHCIISI